ncbi:unnamed protein product [Sphagnum compactum]
MGVGDDYARKPWVFKECMGGDLQDLLDTGMHYVKDGQMPFHYTATIKMMMEIAQGMEDLHRCGLIHEDLQASNIFVTPLMLDSFANGLEQVLVLIYFYIKIGDYESMDGVIGTGFWRPPEVLHTLKDGVVGVETSPAKVEKLLSIHGKAQEKVPAWIVKAGWQNVHRGHHRLNGRADLTHDSPPFHEIALAEIEYLEVAVATRTHNTIAAVARNPALESWVPDSPAASKAWAVAKVAFGLKNSAACEYGQMSFEDWQAANPAGFKRWWQAVAAASEAWDLVSFKVKIAETEVAAAVQAVALLIQCQSPGCGCQWSGDSSERSV